jgi:hypothetical protein
MTESDHAPDDDRSHTYAVRTTTQGKHYLELPVVHMRAAGIEQGEDVGVKPINSNGRFTLQISADSSIGLSRTVRSARHDDSKSLLTIPKRVATAARLSDEPVTYNSESGRIAVIVAHDQVITGIEVYNVDEVMISRWKSGLYTFQIPEVTSEHLRLPLGEEIWFWYDVLGDGFIMGLELQGNNAPEGAIKLNVQHTPRAKSEYRVHLPKQICDALELSGEFMKWGHDGQRILGMLTR